jgi:predicted RNA-binding Zn ribbon-like protein
MTFTPETAATLHLAVDLVNDASERAPAHMREAPRVEGRMVRRLADFECLGPFDELGNLLEVSAKARRAWTARGSALAQELNSMFSAISQPPQLVAHGGYGWHLHAGRVGTASEFVMSQIALALLDVARLGESERLRCCAAPDCRGIVLDLSRNRSKRFCSQRCGNRVNMVAFRTRNR